eukprot:g1756.t1
MKRALTCSESTADYDFFKPWWRSYVQFCRASNAAGGIRVKVTGSKCIGEYRVYEVEVEDRLSATCWKIERRFREFCVLRNVMGAHATDISQPFPRKHLLRSNVAEVVAEREVALAAWLQEAVLLLTNDSDMDERAEAFVFGMGIFLAIPAQSWRINQALFAVVDQNERTIFDSLLQSPFSLSRMKAELLADSPEAVPLLLFCFDYNRLQRKRQAAQKRSQSDSSVDRLADSMLESFFSDTGENTLRHQQLVEVPPWARLQCFTAAEREEFFLSTFTQAESLMRAHFLRYRFDTIARNLDFEQRQMRCWKLAELAQPGTRPSRPKAGDKTGNPKQPHEKPASSRTPTRRLVTRRVP